MTEVPAELVDLGVTPEQYAATVEDARADLDRRRAAGDSGPEVEVAPETLAHAELLARRFLAERQGLAPRRLTAHEAEAVTGPPPDAD